MISDGVHVDVVGLTIVSATCALVLCDALTNGKPGVAGVDVSFIVDDFVDLCGHVVFIFSRKASNDDVIVGVIASYLTIPVVGFARITTATLGVARDLGHITHQKHMSDVCVGIVLVLNIGLDGRVSGTSSACSDYCRWPANLLLPVDERLHGAHEGIVADDEQLAGFDYRSVSSHALMVVDELVGINGIKLGVHLYSARFTGELVLALHTVAVHLNGHFMVYAQGFADRVVGKGIDHHVLSAEIAEDVRLIESNILCREEGIGGVGFAVGVRHIIRIDGAREVTFRRRDFHLKISVLCVNNTDAVLLNVANDGWNGNHGQIGFASGSGAYRFGH